ncbi:KHG/KDPG aldolase-like isoform X3 [Dioscorea cayenensis subsp. rotundata]|uniref:KHG/KDPG aldolase-like isoform X3 n=1 Tax=Dioscorea cayennensis subsp. rotundata TaxID=55577 RepID=A0AB40BJB2_DIOCR|nr:KHG/KDPG aldolase-like isoform X3 [Dioscorea cayenensis subsp. rotundata]
MLRIPNKNHALCLSISFSPASPMAATMLSLSSPLPPSSHPPCSSPPPPPPRALLEIQRSRIIACLRTSEGQLALEASRAALRGGVSVVEIVMSTPGVLEVIKELVDEHPSSVIGVGTVLDAADARKAINVGAKFLMNPCTVMDILFDVQDDEVLYIPGVMTPTEVLSAYKSGARIVKVYPVSILGGHKYISALKKPFPHIPMVASQGIAMDSIGRYIQEGASAVVLSDAIFEKEAMRQRNFDEIQRLARLASFQGLGAGKHQGQAASWSRFEVKKGI